MFGLPGGEVLDFIAAEPQCGIEFIHPTLDGVDTAAKVRRLYRTSIEPRPGPVHIALPSDVARMPDVETQDPRAISLEIAGVPPAPAADVARVAAEIRQARRPVVILGL